MVDGEGYVSESGGVAIEVVEEDFAAAVVATMWILGWDYTYTVTWRTMADGRSIQRNRVYVTRKHAAEVADMVKIRRKRERLKGRPVRGSGSVRESG